MADDTEATSAYLSTKAAERFRQQTASRQNMMREPTELMLDLANLRPGYRVLDVAAGTGDQSFLAAERVGATGSVVATDVSAGMLAVAAEAARSAGLTNIETAVMDARQLTYDDGSFDAVICRGGLMFVPTPRLALTEMWRVLRPGRAASVVVFSTPERNLNTTIPFEVAHRHAGLPPPNWEEPGMVALGAPGLLERLFRGAGFRDVQVKAVTIPIEFRTLEAAMRDRRERAQPVLLQIVEPLGAEGIKRYWRGVEEEFRQFMGPSGFRSSNEVLVAAGLK